jgi:hypothetical protein
MEEGYFDPVIILDQNTQTKHYKRVPYGITQVIGRL